MQNCVTRYLTLTLLALFLNVSLLSIKAIAQPNGESLFKANCTSCHATSDKKVVGPGLKGVHDRHSEEWLVTWIKNSQAMVKAGDAEAVKLFNEYNKTPMPSFGFKDDEVKAILAYVKAEGEKAPAAPVAGTTTAGEPAAASDSGTSPVVVILALLGLIGLFVILNKIKKGLEQVIRKRDGEPEPVVLHGKAGIKNWIRSNKLLIAILFVIGSTWGSVQGWNALAGIGVTQGYTPDQPIKFSHKLHVGQNKIDCRYCHSGAEKSKNAGIPSSNLCMNCHKYVSEGPKYGKDEIAKIYKAIGWDGSNYTGKQQPVEWVRIHNLPDLAYFNHSQHVKVGQIACETCHGPVGEMEEMYQFSPLTMGWCINCHRTTEVKMEGNEYYTKLHENLKKKFGPEAKMTVDKIGGLECARCHY